MNNNMYMYIYLVFDLLIKLFKNTELLLNSKSFLILPLYN